MCKLITLIIRHIYGNSISVFSKKVLKHCKSINTEGKSNTMLSFYIIFSVCLVTYAVNADNSAPENDNVPVITPRGIQKPKHTEPGNMFTASNYRGLGLSAFRPKLPKITNYNNSNYTGHRVYVQGGVTLYLKGDTVSINGKEVPGFNANDVKVVEWGKGSLKVNGITQEIFNGMRGEGIINIGKDNNNTFTNGYNNNRRRDNITKIGQGYSGGIIIDGKRIERTADGLIINGRKVPGVNAYDSIEIDWNQKGGIVVNGEKKAGFEDIKGNGKTQFESKINPTCIKEKGRKVLGYILNLTNLGAGESTTGNGFENQNIIIDRTANGLMINGRKVPGVNEYDSIKIDWNKKSGFAVNGKKMPLDIGSPTVSLQNGQVVMNGKKIPLDIRSPNVSLQNGQVVMNGKKIPLDIRNLNSVVNDEGVVINGKKIPVDELENPLNKAYVGGSEKKQDVTSDGINSKNVTKDVLGKKDIIVDRTDDGLLVNGKKVPGVNDNDGVVIDYDKEGITVDGVKKEGFKGIQGKGRKVLGYILNLTNFGAGESTTGNGFGNINIDRTANGLMINGRKVPGVNAYDTIEIDWNEKGGFAVNGEKKTGFDDIKRKGKTHLASKLNPTNTDGSKSSQS